MPQRSVRLVNEFIFLDRKVKKKLGRPASQLAPYNVSGQIGQMIRAKRESLGLTLQQACDRTGGAIKVSDWSNYEHGAQPKFIKILSICLALDIEPSDLIPSDVVSAFADSSLKPEVIARLN